MIGEQTLFILGAGASAPYGYPTGDQLRKEIIKEFPDKVGYDDYCQGLEKDLIEDIIQMANELSKYFGRSRTSSIDLFLSRRPRFYEIGRRAIAQIIFEREKGSKFEYDMKDASQDWYKYLYRRMSETLIDAESYMGFSANQVSFITFNYDRSLEHYLYDALINSFDIPLHSIQTKELFPFKVIHIYGKLADLDWEDPEGVRYGSYFIPKMISNINIIYDETNEVELKKSITQEITKAKRIFFLGFGYADENLEILGIPEILTDDKVAYGTAYGFSDREIEDIELKFSKTGNRKETRILLQPWKCIKLLTEYL